MFNRKISQADRDFSLLLILTGPATRGSVQVVVLFTGMKEAIS